MDEPGVLPVGCTDVPPVCLYNVPRFTPRDQSSELPLSDRRALLEADIAMPKLSSDFVWGFATGRPRKADVRIDELIETYMPRFESCISNRGLTR